MNAMKFFVAIALFAACALAVYASEQAEAQNQVPVAENSRQKRYPFAYPGAYPAAAYPAAYPAYGGYGGIGYPAAYGSAAALPVAYGAGLGGYGGYGAYPYARGVYGGAGLY